MVTLNMHLLKYVNSKYMSVALDILDISAQNHVDTALTQHSVPLLMGPVLLAAVLDTLDSCVRQNVKVETMVSNVTRPVVIVLIYYIAPMLMARVLLGVSQGMKGRDVNKCASSDSMESAAIKSVAVFAKHHVTVTTFLVLVETAVDMVGRVMIALMYPTYM